MPRGVYGAQPWVTVLCRYADSPQLTPYEPSWFYGAMGDTYPGANHFWKQISYNQANVSGSQVAGWFNLPHPKSYYTLPDGEWDLWKLWEDCLAVADASVYFPNFVGVNLWTNDNIGCCAWGGQSYISRDNANKVFYTTWIGPGGYNHGGIISHEMGHGFGLPHSAAADGYNAARWDVMSNATADCVIVHPTFACLGAGVITYQMDRAGWIDPSRRYVINDGEAANLTLERLNQPPTGENYLMARIPISGTDGHYYTVEARRKVGYDELLAGEAVIIYYVDPTRGTPAWLVDAYDAANPNDEGAMWRVGETFTDTARNISVRVLNEEGSGFRVRIRNDAPPVFCDNVSEIPFEECTALTGLYNTNGGTGWTNAQGWMQTETPCAWQGVACENGHVTSLTLSDSNLTGVLTQKIGNLTALTWLDLSYNGLTGAIPDSIGDLQALNVLVLNDNELSGALPASMGSLTNLTWLGLWHNALSGPLPPELGGMTSLTHFLAGVNAITGTIPAALVQLPNLEWFDVSYNQLSGDVPAAFGDNGALVGANLRYNLLTFSDPDVYNKLSVLDMSSLNTQTVPVTDLQVTNTDDTHVTLLWSTVPYFWDSGRYEIWAKALGDAAYVQVGEAHPPLSRGGGDVPYTPVGETLDKAVSQYTISDLLPGTSYSFMVRTVSVITRPPTWVETATLTSGDSAPVTGSTQPGLLANGGMERSSDGTTLPDGWKVKQAENDRQRCNTTEAGYAYSGVCVFQFSGEPSSPKDTLKQALTVSGTAGDAYTLTLWLRQKNLPSNASVKLRVRFINAATGQNYALVIPRSSLDKTYQRFAFEGFTAPFDYTGIRVEVIFNSTAGWLRVDHLVLSALDDEPRLPAAVPVAPGAPVLPPAFPTVVPGR